MKRKDLLNKLLPWAIALLGIIIGYSILTSGTQKPNRGFKKGIKKVRTVQTMPLEQGSVTPSWHSSGFVIAAETVDVYPRVAGDIETINPIATPGGMLEKGQWLAQLETTDLELSLKSAKSQLKQAKASLNLELANQTLAKEELALLGQRSGLNVDESLVLREPELIMAKARVEVAENDVEKVALDLSRTKVLMPFTGQVVSREVGVGSKVSANSTLFSVVNTGVYWLEVKIPHKFLALFDRQQPARLTQPRLWGDKQFRHAEVISVLPELDSSDRQVKVLLAIHKPLTTNQDAPQVFINDFLHVELLGKPITDAWTLEYSWLQADNSIWVVDNDNRLQKRQVDVLFKGRELIYVSGDFKAGDQALAEKPGIANVGMQVKTKQSLSHAMKQKQLPQSEQQSIKLNLNQNHQQTAS